MPDYIYLLENRLSADQRNALSRLREAARDAGVILFLTGDAVRDLTSGHAVRELEVAVHGNVFKLKKPLEKLGAKVWGEEEATHSLYLCFPGTVRVDVISTHRVEYPKPGKAVYHPASIQEDLRRRDFTANAMAISLNEGSFGLLMDPLNGAADIEGRVLRLVSSYGFLEDPSLLIRAIRYKARLSWEMDQRTQARYENAKMEGMIEHLSTHARRRELEQIGHEEEGLKVLRALEEEDWMKVLFPAWTSSRADEPKLKLLHELAVELLMQGVHPDMSAAQMQLLTAGMSSKDLSGLKKSLLRPGFVEEWDSLDSLANGFQKVLLDKKNAAPSATYKLFMSYDPEAILWLGFTSKNAAVRERYEQFLKVWPEARQRIPYTLMQEMRITPELANFNEIAQNIFLELIDGKLLTPEEMRSYLEPFSPPPPPVQQPVKRTRVRRAEKMKEIEEEEAEESAASEEDLEDLGGDEEELDLGLGKAAEAEESEEGEEEEAEEEEEVEPATVRGRKKNAAEPAKKAEAKPAAKAEKPAPKAAVKHGKAETSAKAKTDKRPPAAAAKPVAKGKPAAKHAVKGKSAKAVPAGKAAHAAAKSKPATPAHRDSARRGSAHRGAPAHITGKGGKPVLKAKPKAAVAKHSKPAAKKSAAKPARKR
jgi:tRNA nucleotidyltransferase (CCA-adding enzyme)